MDFESSFCPFSVSSVCEGVRFAGLGENKILKSKIQSFIRNIELIKTKTSVSVQICLDSREISVSKQIRLKNQSSPFSKRFLGFVHIFEWILIQPYKFIKFMILFLYRHFKLKR